MRSVPALIVFALVAACGDGTPTSSVETELSVPPELEVGPPNVNVATYHAVGFQIYECSAAGTWGLRAPAALLFDDDQTVAAVHFGGIDAGLPPGPYWKSTLDGSQVHGGSPTAVPNPPSIPQLRLVGLDSTGDGVFTGVTFIQRLATTGGVAPTTPCKRAGTKSYVPYTATYVFWAS